MKISDRSICTTCVDGECTTARAVRNDFARGADSNAAGEPSSDMWPPADFRRRAAHSPIPPEDLLTARPPPRAQCRTGGEFQFP